MGTQPVSCSRGGTALVKENCSLWTIVVFRRMGSSRAVLTEDS